MPNETKGTPEVPTPKPTETPKVTPAAKKTITAADVLEMLKKHNEEMPALAAAAAETAHERGKSILQRIDDTSTATLNAIAAGRDASAKEHAALGKASQENHNRTHGSLDRVEAKLTPRFEVQHMILLGIIVGILAVALGFFLQAGFLATIMMGVAGLFGPLAIMQMFHKKLPEASQAPAKPEEKPAEKPAEKPKETNPPTEGDGAPAAK